MTKISSAWTPFFKRVFPVLWFGFLAVFVVGGLWGGALAKDPMFLVIPMIMAAFGYFIMKNLVWILADEVYDCGDHLLVKKGREEERVYLSNVMNVSATTLVSPPQITLRLITPGRFGTEVVFSPAIGFTINPFRKSQVAEELMVRAHHARANSGANKGLSAKF